MRCNVEWLEPRMANKRVCIDVEFLQGDTKQLTWHPSKAGDTKSLYANGKEIARLTYRFEEKHTPAMSPETLTHRIGRR